MENWPELKSAYPDLDFIKLDFIKQLMTSKIELVIH